MKKATLVILAILVASVAFAEPSVIRGPHATVETDGSQADGSVNLLTNNAGPICFSTNKVKRQCVPSDGAGLVAPTADGSDTSAVCFSGGGACGANRGAFVTLYGNETNGGGIEVNTGNAGGPFAMYPRGDGNRSFKFDAGSDTAHTLTFGDGGTTDDQNLYIQASTGDGDDNSAVYLSGGGAYIPARGASIGLIGSDRGGANAGGGIYLSPGVGSGSGLFVTEPNYGARFSHTFAYTTVTPSGATTDTSNFIPAGSVVLGCTARVVTAITGATSWSLGPTTDTDRYGTGIAVALNTTTSSTNWVPATAGEGVEWHTNVATALRLTSAGSNFTGGSVRIICLANSMAGPTS